MISLTRFGSVRQLMWQAICVSGALCCLATPLAYAVPVETRQQAFERDTQLVFKRSMEQHNFWEEERKTIDPNAPNAQSLNATIDRQQSFIVRGEWQTFEQLLVDWFHSYGPDDLVRVGTSQLDPSFFEPFLSFGETGSLNFHYIDPRSGLPVLGPPTAWVVYEAIRDPDDTDQRSLLGTSFDVTHDFALGYTLTGFEEIVIGTPYDAAGTPIFLSSNDPRENVAPGWFMVFRRFPVPLPGSLPLLVFGVASIAAMRWRAGLMAQAKSGHARHVSHRSSPPERLGDARAAYRISSKPRSSSRVLMLLNAALSSSKLTSATRSVAYQASILRPPAVRNCVK